MSIDSFVYHVYWKIFPKKTMMNEHVKQFHQLIIKAWFENETFNSIERNIDELFEYLCDKKHFLNPKSLYKYLKRYFKWIMTLMIKRNISITDFNSKLNKMIELNSIIMKYENQFFHEMNWWDNE